MNSQPNDVNAAAARKMAIVDAMKPEERKIVWEIGLDAYSRKFSRAYKVAKRRAGIKGACAFTQTAEVARKNSKKAA